MLSTIWSLIETVIRFVFKCASKIGINISDEKIEGLLQFVKFGMVGLSNTAITMITYTILVVAGVNYQIGNAIGYVAGVTNSFYWNNKYVFKAEEGVERSWFKAYIKCFVSYLGGYFVSVVVLFLWVDVLNLNEYIAPFINLIITIPLNFILNKKWAFKDKKEAA